MSFYSVHLNSRMYVDNYTGGSDLLDCNMNIDEINVNLAKFYFFLKSYSGVKTPWQAIRGTILTKGFCIDNNLKLLLENYKLPQYEYLKMDCEFRGKSIDYWWFYLKVKPVQDYIDLRHSTFYDESQQVAAINVDDYLKEEYPLQSITWLRSDSIKELVIKEELGKYDMFCLRHFPSLYLVSERLKKDMEKQKCKGLIFQEATWLKII